MLSIPLGTYAVRFVSENGTIDNPYYELVSHLPDRSMSSFVFCIHFVRVRSFEVDIYHLGAIGP